LGGFDPTPRDNRVPIACDLSIGGDAGVIYSANA
jgi:hypothetical protein